ESIISGRVIEFVHRPGKDNHVADGLSRNPGLEARTAEGDATEMGWEAAKGLTNSYMGICRVAIDEDIALVDRFADDDLEDVVRWITQTDHDLIEEDDIEDVKQRAVNYWIEDGELRKRVEGYGRVTVIPCKEGPKQAKNTHESNGHLGRDLMISSLVKSFSWKTMRKDV
ncbi:hypothetical protein HD553DRAFT_261727, partial [Filobasidium floriforme]|uniref:uncharacterized protein n=1 Tax=Filobasidium floriforme TaxID=5210 RepID=UPI001E8E0913